MSDHGWPLTRRGFTRLTGTTLALTVLGCERKAAPGRAADKPVAEKAELPKEPFDVGPMERYAAAGFYGDLADSKRVWLVSDGQRLVALLDECTHSGCGLVREEGRLVCPCHNSHFDEAGAPQAGSKATKPLPRLGIAVEEQGGVRTVRVDPGRRFEGGQWDEAGASVAVAG